MNGLLFKVFAVVRKDFLILIKYKLNLLMTFLSVILYISGLLFFSGSYELKGDTSSVDLFFYIISGLIVLDMTQTCSTAAPLTINFYQTSGIQDELISNEQNFLLICISSTLVPLFISIFKIFLYIIFASLIFNYEQVINQNILHLLVMLLIYFASIIGITLFAACFTLIFKRGNPILQINMIMIAFVGGAFFPASNINEIFLEISNFLPAKHMIDLMRLYFETESENNFLFTNSGLSLFFLSMLFLIIGVITFKFSIRYAKIKGITSNY